jgi:ADP-heptose:LPS heptosyltransferase
VREKILLIRLKSIGDVVLTLPAVNVIRENFPDAKITFLTSEENAVLLLGFREVDEVITLDRAALRSGNPLKVAAEFFGLLRRLRFGKFDLAVDFQSYGETAWLTRITGAPQRWGQIHRAGRGWAYTRRIEPDLKIHPAEWHRSLLKECGLKLGAVRNEFILPETTLNEARAWFAGHQLDSAKRTIYIQPFTSGAHKNWPLENYFAIARHWRKAGCQIILGGGPADRSALESAQREGFAISAGVPLLVTGGLMQLSTLVFGGDTGALHLAVALGKRVLMLMHQASPGSPTPYQHRDWIVVAPKPEAIAKISVDEVNAAIKSAFNEQAGNVSC